MLDIDVDVDMDIYVRHRCWR